MTSREMKNYWVGPTLLWVLPPGTPHGSYGKKSSQAPLIVLVQGVENFNLVKYTQSIFHNKN
jgi:hypothetical protein